jgi:hypothetical protein
MADEPRIIVNGREYPIPDSFTMGELADMEAITGQDYDPSKEGYRGTLALVFVAVKRVDPRVTLDDIRELKEDDLDIKGLPDSPPALGASNGAAPTSSKGSGKGSVPTPDATPAPTGTKS